MNNKKMIITDLDGTALGDWSTLHPQTKQALMAAKDAGHVVVIATGRPARASLHFYEELELTTPMINFNGAYIHHPSDETFEDIICEIPKEMIFDLFDSKLGEHMVNAFCEYKDHLYILDEHSITHEFFHIDTCKTVTYGPFKETLDRHPSGFLLETKPGYAQQVVDYLRENYSDVIACRKWEGTHSNVIEVFHPEVNKGTAITALANHFGIDIKDTIAFGDASNDLEMLEVAGVGVAMENGSDELKAVANVISKSNKEAGVAHYLYEHLLTAN